MHHPRRNARRSLRVGALVIASGTAVVAAATGAGAAATSAPASYAGTTASTALSVSLLQDAVSLQLLPAQASLEHSAGNSDSAGSTVALYGGTPTQGAASPAATSSLSSLGPNKASGAFGLPDPLSLGPVGSAAIPDLTASSAKTPLSTTSSASGLDVDALTLSDLVPAAALTQFTTGCTTLTSQIGTLITALGTLDTTLAAGFKATKTPDPLATLITALKETKTQATDVCNDIADGAVLSVKGLVSSSSISTIGSQEVSTSHVELGSISLLGGFASVTGFDNTVTAKAGGTPGTASFTPTISNGGLGALTFAGNTAGIDGSGLEADFQGVDAALKALNIDASDLDSVFTALQSGLAQLDGTGIVTITADTPSKVAVAQDGTSATGELDGLDLGVNLPTGLPSPTGSSGSTALTGLLNQLINALGSQSTGGQSLGTILSGLIPSAKVAHTTSAAATSAPIQVLSLQVGSVGAAAEAQDGTLPTTVKGETITKTPTASGPAPAAKLAFTGADLPVTGGVALLLVLGGAYAIRRRCTGHDEL